MPQPAPTAEDLAVLDPDDQFPVRLAADRTAIERLALAGDLDGAGRIVHRLAGAAGTFGYVQVGETAVAIDDRIAAGGGPVTKTELARLLQMIDHAVRNAEKSV